MKTQKYFIWGSITFVVLAIVGAFLIIGSPTQKRQLRLDERRLGDLYNLQYQIARYYEVKGSLPEDLSDLQGFEGMSVPTDPITEEYYEYSLRTPNEFELCAQFALASDSTNELEYSEVRFRRGDSGQVWTHDSGRDCFSLTIEEASAGVQPSPSITVKPI